MDNCISIFTQRYFGRMRSGEGESSRAINRVGGVERRRLVFIGDLDKDVLVALCHLMVSLVLVETRVRSQVKTHRGPMPVGMWSCSKARFSFSLLSLRSQDRPSLPGGPTRGAHTPTQNNTCFAVTGNLQMGFTVLVLSEGQPGEV